MAEGGGMRLPARSTRGNRMGALITEAKEEGDDEFWGQDAFKEEANDDEYESEKEEADLFDSDFGESEDEDDDDEGEGGDDEPRRKAALRPPGEVKRKKPPGAPKPGAAPRALAELEGLVTATADGTAAAAPARAKAPKPVVELTADMMRKSKRSTVLEMDLQRERAAAEAAARPAKAKPKRPVDERPPTQEEMLAEAVHTELQNAASLARILAMEEEHKKRAAVAKRVHVGPSVRFRSTVRGAGGAPADTLTFLHGAQPARGEPLAPPPPPPVCAVTGRLARFRDPRTSLPYADVAAFKVLRAAAANGTLHSLPFAPRAPPPPPQEEDMDADPYGGGGGGAGPAGGYGAPAAAFGVPPGLQHALQWAQHA